MTQDWRDVADSPGLIAARLSSQLLAGAPARAPDAVAERLLAVQAQDARGARLAIRARTRGLTAADVDRALNERSLVITWLNRGTLHLVCSEDYAWLHALTAPPLLGANARRLSQEGVSSAAAERGVSVVERALGGEGPLTRGQLREHLSAARVPTKGQALVHVLMLASLRGIAVRGPMVGGEQAYVRVGDWLGEPAQLDRDRALAELARRYLAGHGPAGDRDLAKWAGVPLRDARAGLEAIANELNQRPDGLLDLAGRRNAGRLPPPRLLGAYEPVLLGWTSRAPLLGEYEGRVTVEGLFRPFALVRGQAAAVWSIRAGKVVLEPFGHLGREDAEALDADAEAVLRYLSLN